VQLGGSQLASMLVEADICIANFISKVSFSLYLSLSL
jgi:hypothetical protein